MKNNIRGPFKMCTTFGFVITGKQHFLNVILSRWIHKENDEGLYCFQEDLRMFSEGLPEYFSFKIGSNLSGCSCGLFTSYFDHFDSNKEEVRLTFKVMNGLKELIDFILEQDITEVRFGNNDRYFDISVKHETKESLFEIIDAGLIEDETIYSIIKTDL